MRKIILIILLIFFLLIPTNVNSQSKEFVEVKRLAMNASPDEDGDYALLVSRMTDSGAKMYACLYLPKYKAIGVLKAEDGNVIIIWFSEENGFYVMAQGRGGRIIFEIEISEQQASAFVQEILIEF